MPFFNTIYTEFLDLILPRYCCACSRVLHSAERYLCLLCLYDLPLTRFECYPLNPVFKLFWGRVRIRQATALLFFRSSGKAREMIHQLKYRGQPGLAYYLGYMLGECLLHSPEFDLPEFILPVPLGPARRYKRGYNQCFHIAKGIAAATGAKLNDQLLKTSRNRSTQTKKGKYERYLNLQDGGFQISAKHLEAKIMSAESSILLIDDVITTGATLESCANMLQLSGFNQISIAALAWTAD